MSYETYGASPRTGRRRHRQAGRLPPRSSVCAPPGSAIKIRAAGGFVLGEMLHDLGCVNLADSGEVPLETLSLEYISPPSRTTSSSSSRVPTPRAMDTLERPCSQPRLGRVCTVQEGRFYTLEHSLYNLKLTPAEAYEKLRDLYPA